MYSTEWKLWKADSDETYVVAKTAEEAASYYIKHAKEAYVEAGSEDLHAIDDWDHRLADSWTMLLPEESLELLGEDRTVKDWVEGKHCDWSPKNSPWLLDDEDEDIFNYVPDGEDEEEKEEESPPEDVQIAIRRPCPCKDADRTIKKCALCAGEGHVTIFIDAETNSDAVSVSTSEVKAAFAPLDAYRTLLNAGFSIQPKN